MTPRFPSRATRFACVAALSLIAGRTLLATATPSPGSIPSLSYTWRDVVIGGGGFVTGLVFHPAQRDLLYARTDVGGAFRWEAAQQRWIPLNDSLAAEHAEWLGVVSLALDPRNPQRLYLATGSYLPAWGKSAALLSSPDQGASWSRVVLPFRLGGNSDGRSTGERLQVDPHEGRIIFLGTNQDGLWRSIDTGRTWARMEKFPASGLTLVLLDARSGTDGQPTPTLYAGASDPRQPALYRSTDAGLSWAPLPGQPTGLIPHHAAIDSLGTLYIAYSNALGPNDISDGAVWKFSPEKNQWTDITPLAPNAATKDTFGYAGLALDAQHPGVVMVSTLDRWTLGDEIFRSTDRGATWKPIRAASTWDASSAPYASKLKPHWIGDLALDPFNSTHALFTTGYGLWSTAMANAADTGATTPWRFANAGLEETVAEDLISPPSGAPLLSALGDIGGFRHDTFSASPPAGAHEPPFGTNSAIAFAEHMPAKLVRTHSGSARGAVSLDGGSTWRDFSSTPPPAAPHGAGSIALSADGRRIVWLPKGSAPFLSTDDGASWTVAKTAFVSSRDFHTDRITADRVSPDKFYSYESVGGRVFASLDGGVSFSVVATLPPGGGTIRAEPGCEGRVWVPTPEGLHVSRDAGAHFEKIPRVEAAAQIGFGAPAASGGPATLFILGRISGVPALFRSDDSGASWIAINDAAHKFGYLKVITGDPRVPGRVYLGTGGRGIIVGEPAAK